MGHVHRVTTPFLDSSPRDPGQTGWRAGGAGATLKKTKGGQLATIVCGIDDPPGAFAAVRTAKSLSGSFEVRLVLAHVVLGWGGTNHEGLTARQGVLGGKVLLERAVREYELDADRRVEVGDPVEMLARIAAEEGASMIVVGANRRRRWRWSRKGLARELAATAPCPVLVVPPPL